jgi:hypothetical protein
MATWRRAITLWAVNIGEVEDAFGGFVRVASYRGLSGIGHIPSLPDPRVTYPAPFSPYEVIYTLPTPDEVAAWLARLAFEG